MKKLFLLLSLVFVSNLFSQEIEKPVTTTTTTVSTTSSTTKKLTYTGKKHEIKLDPTYLIFAGALNISYERILSEESGLGVSLILSNGKEINTTFSLTPYYRFYFGRKSAAGFFIEGFTSINSFEYDFDKHIQISNPDPAYNYNYYYERKSSTDLAIGIGLGGKWITNKGVIFELSGGIGRNLLNDYSTGNNDGLPSTQELVGRGGISIGYRF